MHRTELNLFISSFAVLVIAKQNMNFKTFIIFAIVPQVLLSPVKVKDDESLAIIHGFKVDIKDVPYQAIIEMNSMFGWTLKCGAVIIAPKVLLTAAVCLSTKTELRVRVGSSKLISGGTYYNISKKIIHEHFDNLKHSNDIGMLVTTYEMEFSESVQPVPYAREDHLQDGTETLVSGFGITESLKVSQHLLAATIYIVNQRTCNESYATSSFKIEILDSMVCATSENPISDSCQGDGGGPLVSNGTLVGIVSFGIGCAQKKYPGVYTRVPYFGKWIDEHVNKFA